jgi:hypothetical protein
MTTAWDGAVMCSATNLKSQMQTTTNKRSLDLYSIRRAGRVIRRSLAVFYATGLLELVFAIPHNLMQPSEAFELGFGLFLMSVTFTSLFTVLVAGANIRRLLAIDDLELIEPLLIALSEPNLCIRQIDAKIGSLLPHVKHTNIQLQQPTLDVLTALCVKALLPATVSHVSSRKFRVSGERLRVGIKHVWGKQGATPDDATLLTVLTPVGLRCYLRLLAVHGGRIQYDRICRTLDRVDAQNNEIDPKVSHIVNRWGRRLTLQDKLSSLLRAGETGTDESRQEH